MIDGGEGVDTAIFSGLYNSHVFVWNEGDLHVISASGDTDILRGVEYLVFDDVVIAASELSGSQPAPLEAVADTAAGSEDVALTINVLSNDTGNDLSVISANNGAFGTVTVNASGVVIYTPAANAYGTDEFHYTIMDESGATSTTHVSVEISAVNDAPDANADSYSTQIGQALTGADSVLSNDRDARWRRADRYKL